MARITNRALARAIKKAHEIECSLQFIQSRVIDPSKVLPDLKEDVISLIKDIDTFYNGELNINYK